MIILKSLLDTGLPTIPQTTYFIFYAQRFENDRRRILSKCKILNDNQKNVNILVNAPSLSY